MRKLLLLALLAPLLSMCQPLSLTGKIRNEQNEPVAGATITLIRTGAAITSNAEGGFYLANLHLNDTLLITAVGYQSVTEVFDQSLSLHGQLTILLKRRIGLLDEAVIIAYGTTTRRLSTGSISRITAEEIARQPVSNPLAALAGLVPGLFVSQANGLPGANFSVQIRGLNSLKQGTQPLYIVDGVPFMLNSGSLGQINLTNNNIFNTINPADIQSIEVLKDADATAIYGSQGANGVVLITTKKSESGKMLVNVSFNTGFGKPTRLLALFNTPQYLQMRREAFANDGQTPTASTAPDLLTWDKDAYTNWQKELTGGTARTQNLLLSLSGGSATTGFLLSSGWYTETAVFPGNNPYHKGTLRLAITQSSIDKKFKLTFSPWFTADKKLRPVNDLTAYTLLPPNAPAAQDDAGNLVWTAGIENPYAYLYRTYEAQTRELGSSMTLNYKLLPNLSVKGALGYNSITLSEEATIPISAQRPSSTTTGTAQWASAFTQSWVAEPYLEYKWARGNQYVTLVGGASWQQRAGTNTSITGTRYANDDLLGLMASAGQLTLSNGKSLYKYAALFGRATYAFGERYRLNVNARRDGSSRFGPANRFATFASVGGAWLFSNERFMKKAKKILSFGKLRYSAGVTGSDQIGDYQYLDSWSSSSFYQYNGAPAGVLPARLFNPSFQWEKVSKQEMAMELGFFHDQILLTISAYRNRSSNQLVNYKLPLTTGFNSILQNLAAKLQNTGLEIELNAKAIQTAKLYWNISANISVQRNKLLAYPGLENSSDKFNFSIGQPLRVLFAYRYTGVDPSTGIYTFQDVDGNNLLSTSDLQVVGTPQQDFFGGLTSSWSWKGLELACLWQFVRQTGRSYLSTLSAVPGTLSNQPLIVMERWIKPGDQTEVQQFTTRASTAAYKAYNFYRSSSASLADASFIRLRNLSLSWQLPGPWIKKMHASAARLSVQGQNLLTLTNYQGADPETQSLTSLPPLRIFTAGIHITF